MKITSILILFYLFTNAFAQSSDSLKNYLLEEITVTTTRNEKLLEKTPEVMRVITSKEIQALNVSSTGEILDYLTGVNVESGTGSGSPKRSIISMDGFPAKYTLVMVDGIRLLTEHIHTGQNIDLIPPESIERIEVIKGAASSQYGSDAMGGIVNIITKKASSKTESLISFAGGSYDTYKATMAVYSPISDNVSMSIFSNYEESAGVPILSPAHRIDNMGYTELTTMANIILKINNKSSIRTNLLYVQTSMEFREDNVYGNMLLSSIDYIYAFSNQLVSTARLKYSHWDAEQSGETNSVLNPEIFLTWNKFNNNIITMGGDFRYMNFARSSVLEHDQLAYAIFLQDEMEFEKLSFLAALRVDKVENIELVVSPKIAVMYRAFDCLRLRGSFGRGFHAPTVQELYEEGYGHGGRAYRFGNPNLKPEYSLTSTLSAELAVNENIQIFIYGYYNTIKDMITPIYNGIWEENPDTTTEIDKWVRTNIHKAEIYGVETSLRYRTNEFLFEVGYNYADNKNVSTGGQLPYYPGESFFSKIIYNYNISHQLSGSCFVTLRATKNRSAWNWKPVSGSDYDNPDGLITELKNYQLLNAGIKLIYNRNIDLGLNIINILGQNIEKLDDSFTVIDGEPVYKVSFSFRF